MLPLLAPGDEVMVNRRAYRRRRPSSGEVVVALHPAKADLVVIKRVKRLERDGRIYLEGDNPNQSSDSRVYGPFSPDQILGRVTSRLP